MAKKSLIKAVEIARKSVMSPIEIIGSIGPLEDCYLPDLFPGVDIALSEFFQLGTWLTEIGVDILMLETMNSIKETRIALDALKDFELPIWVSFVLKDENHLLSGEELFDALIVLTGYHIDMLLLNCNPLKRTRRAVDNVVDNWSDSWGVYPNLGRGEPAPDGHITKHETMVKYLSVIEYARDKGASILGACCGSSPEHIIEIKKLQYDL